MENMKNNFCLHVSELHDSYTEFDSKVTCVTVIVTVDETSLCFSKKSRLEGGCQRIDAVQMSRIIRTSLTLKLKHLQ